MLPTYVTPKIVTFRDSHSPLKYFMDTTLSHSNSWSTVYPPNNDYVHFGFGHM